MAELFPLGAILARIASQTARPNFEFRFNQMQNTIIRRVNKEIARVNDSSNSNRHKVEKLRRDGLKLADALPLVTAYREGNFNNLGQLERLIEDATTLTNALGADDAVDQAEVDAFNAERDLIVERLENLFFFIHPDLVDGNAIQILKDEIDTLNALAPEVGSKSGLAANQTATDAVTTFLAKADNALSVTTITVSTALDLEQKIQSDLISNQSEFVELTALDQARKVQEIENIKIDFANILSAISLSFEGNQGFAEELNKFLTPFRPAPGSILNLFV